jgi:hypothetical protein
MIAPIRSELKTTTSTGPVVRVQVSENVANEASGADESSPSLVKAATSAKYGGAKGWRSPQTLALGFIAFAALNLSLMRVCVKYASGQVTSHETVLWRSSVAWLLNLVLVFRRDVKLAVAPKHRNMLFWRCFFGTFGISIQFYAMAQMVLTDATVIIFLSPIVTFMLVSWAERRGELRCVLSSCADVLLIAAGRVGAGRSHRAARLRQLLGLVRRRAVRHEACVPLFPGRGEQGGAAAGYYVCTWWLRHASVLLHHDAPAA